MYFARFILIGLSLSVLPLQVSTVWAQTQATPTEPQISPMRTTIPNLQFPGGTLGDYVKTLQEVGGTTNFMIASPEALEVKLPPIKLQSVAFDTAVKLMEGKFPITDTLFAHISVEQLVAFGDMNAVPVYRISMSQSGMPYSNSVRVWNIGELLGADRKAEDILTAVETAVGLLYVKEKAQIRYHAATTLLVASGWDVQLQAIESVVVGLREGLEQTRQKQAEDQQDELSALVARLKQTADPKEIQIYDLLQSCQRDLWRSGSKIQDLEQALQQAKDRK